MPDSFKPTEKMAANARLGLRLRKQFGRGGTEVGVRRAQQLADRRQLEPSDINQCTAISLVTKSTRTRPDTAGAQPKILRQASSLGCYGVETKEETG